MKSGRTMLLGGAAATVMGAPAGMAADHQTVTGPVAVYWMSAATTSGMGGMMGGMGGGGGRPNAAAMMAAMQGGQNSYSHSLVLQLGSSRRAGRRRPDRRARSSRRLLDAPDPYLPLVSPQPAGARRPTRKPSPAHHRSFTSRTGGC